MLVRGWLLLIHTCSGRAQQKATSAWPSWTQEEDKMEAFVEGGLAKMKNSLWLVGQHAPPLHLSASGLFVKNAQKSHFSISRCAWNSKQGGVTGDPKLLACIWAICLTLNHGIC